MAAATDSRSCSVRRLIHWIIRLPFELGKIHGMAQKVNDTGLNAGLGKRRLDRLKEALQPVYYQAGDF